MNQEIDDKDCIQIIDKNKVTNVDQVEATETLYGVNAQQLVNEVEIGAKGQRRNVENPDCYCKILSVDNLSQYYIKADIDGHLANPWESITTVGQQNKFATRSGRSFWKFVKVDKDCFDLYMNFLKTHNTVHFRACERIVKNG